MTRNELMNEKKKVSILVGICSGQGLEERRNAVRDSWLRHPQEGVECRFFIGGEAAEEEKKPAAKKAAAKKSAAKKTTAKKTTAKKTAAKAKDKE